MCILYIYNHLDSENVTRQHIHSPKLEMSSFQTNCDPTIIDMCRDDGVKHMESDENGGEVRNCSEECETDDYSDEYPSEDSSNEDSCDEDCCSSEMALDGSRCGNNSDSDHSDGEKSLWDCFSVDDCSNEDCCCEGDCSDEGCSSKECSGDESSTENCDSSCGGEAANSKEGGGEAGVNDPIGERDPLVGRVLKGGCKSFYKTRPYY